MDLYEELLGVIDVLTAKRIDYALCEGVAVAFHGYPRFTKDIDLLILSKDLPRVQKALLEREFISAGSPLKFGARGRPSRVTHRITKFAGENLLMLDLILVNPDLQDAWDGREIYDWKDRKVSIVSRQGLAVMKRLAGRDQDNLDLKQLGLLEHGKDKREEERQES
ncbi:MAG: hypothetical protein HYU36_09780 [Planctomycetes bacterium]|nr:hypothetical protein [Planctomycetota bacterium]